MLGPPVRLCGCPLPAQCASSFCRACTHTPLSASRCLPTAQSDKRPQEDNTTERVGHALVDCVDETLVFFLRPLLSGLADAVPVPAYGFYHLGTRSCQLQGQLAKSLTQPQKGNETYGFRVPGARVSDIGQYKFHVRAGIRYDLKSKVACGRTGHRNLVISG